MMIIFGAGLAMALISFLGEIKRTNLDNATILFLVTFGTWCLFFGGFLIALRVYTQPKLEPQEKVLKAEWGSSDFGNGRMGGFLYLTRTRLIFKSHFLSRVKGYQNSILLQDIANTKKDGQNLIVKTHQGQTIYFLLNDADDWTMKIAKPITS